MTKARSGNLLSIAKRVVEIAVETSEDEALVWLAGQVD